MLDATGAEIAGAPSALAGAGEGVGGFETLGGSGLTSAVDNPGAYTYDGGVMTGPPDASVPNAYTYGAPTTNEPTTLSGPPAPGAPSSLWDQSLGIAGKIMTTPGAPSLLAGVLNGYEQGKMIDAQQKWAEAHAPGQVAGGAAGAWNGMAMNQNLKPNTPMPTAAKLPALSPYQQPSPQMPQVPMPGADQPGSNSARYPGYGTPGYGQQAPSYPPSIMAPQQGQDDGLLSQTPFIDSPYDQSYA